MKKLLCFCRTKVTYILFKNARFLMQIINYGPGAIPVSIHFSTSQLLVHLYIFFAFSFFPYLLASSTFLLFHPLPFY